MESGKRESRSADKDGGGDVTKTADYLLKRFKKNVYSKSGSLAPPTPATIRWTRKNSSAG